MLGFDGFRLTVRTGWVGCLDVLFKKVSRVPTSLSSPGVHVFKFVEGILADLL